MSRGEPTSATSAAHFRKPQPNIPSTFRIHIRRKPTGAVEKH